MATLMVLGAFCAAAGAFLARWGALVIPVLVVAAFYGSLHAGWWGNGLGDNWSTAALIVFCVFEAGTAVAIAVARGGGSFRTRRISRRSS